MYGPTYSKSMDQPGRVINPARGQLNRENGFPLSAFAPENLVSRNGFGSTVPRQPAHLHTQAESGAYLRDSSRVPRRRLSAVSVESNDMSCAPDSTHRATLDTTNLEVHAGRPGG